MYGFVIPAAGMDLLAGLLASDTLTIARVTVGSGRPEPGSDMSELTDLVSPVANATISVPIKQGNTCSFTIEYRNDMHGGLEHGFWLNEFGVFATDPESGGEVLIYYGTLGDFPQPVSSFVTGTVDARRFPVSIVLTNDSVVEFKFPPMAFMTASEVERYFQYALTESLDGEDGRIRANLEARLDEMVEEIKAEWGQANGVATLDEDGKVPLENLPDMGNTSTIKQAEPPEGDDNKLWINTTNDVIHYWNGVAWKPTSGTAR